MVVLDQLARLSPIAPGLLIIPVLGFLGLGAIVSAIWGAVRWLAEKAATIAVAVAHAVAIAARYTWNGLKWLGARARDAALWLRDRAVDVARWLRDKVWPWLQRLVDRISEWFRRSFGWLVKLLKIVSRALDWVYTKVLRPLLTFLESVRLVLRGLAALGVEWAARLEQRILALEQRIFQTFLTIVQHVNQLADILGVIFDLSGAIRRSIMVWSAWSFIGDLAVLFQLARIRSNPFPEALRLAAGPDPRDLRRTGNRLELELRSPPPWVLLAGVRLDELLRRGNTTT